MAIQQMTKISVDGWGGRGHFTESRNYRWAAIQIDIGHTKCDENFAGNFAFGMQKMVAFSQTIFRFSQIAESINLWSWLQK